MVWKYIIDGGEGNAARLDNQVQWASQQDSSVRSHSHFPRQCRWASDCFASVACSFQRAARDARASGADGDGRNTKRVRHSSSCGALGESGARIWERPGGLMAQEGARGHSESLDRCTDARAAGLSALSSSLLAALSVSFVKICISQKSRRAAAGPSRAMNAHETSRLRMSSTKSSRPPRTSSRPIC